MDIARFPGRSDGAEGQVKILNVDKFRAERTMVVVVN